MHSAQPKAKPQNSRRDELTEQQRAEFDALRNMQDEEIDYSDIPETLGWSNARRGMFYTPEQRETTLKLDKYVLDWFRSITPDGQDYDEAVNQALLEHIKRMRSSPGREEEDDMAALSLSQWAEEPEDEEWLEELQAIWLETSSGSDYPTPT